jgi:hypothetical protein
VRSHFGALVVYRKMVLNRRWRNLQKKNRTSIVYTVYNSVTYNRARHVECIRKEKLAAFGALSF